MEKSLTLLFVHPPLFERYNQDSCFQKCFSIMDSSESFNSDPFTFAGTKRKKIYSPSRNRTFRSPARKAKKSPRQVKTGRVAKAGKRIVSAQRRGSLLPSQTQQSDITGLKGNALGPSYSLFLPLILFSVSDVSSSLLAAGASWSS